MPKTRFTRCGEVDIGLEIRAGLHTGEVERAWTFLSGG
jgi:hypothetical protein